MLSVSIRQIEYVVAVAEQGSVSAAAAAMHVSQPALSVAIAGLEETLGQALFIRRKGSPVVPTSFGRGFIIEARKILSLIGDLMEPTVTTVEQQPIVIGCFEDLAPIILGPVLSRFRDEHPEAKISTRIGDFQLLSEEMLAGRIDFAITYDLGLDKGFDRKVIANLWPIVLVDAMHRLAGKTMVSLEELAGEPLVLAGQSISVRHMIDLFQQRGLEPHVAHTTETLEIMRSFVANGLGVGLSYTLPRTPRSYDGKEVHAIEIADDLPSEPVVIAVNRANPPSRYAVRMIDEISEMQLL